ncbi:hypothetical protein KL946_003486 [Ogataea haglerorum]|uniref:Uncharacterized protein n=1 Tax=Ogataea haglerorum TaxID=1937702 RepID=A0ABQ7RE76_9ASCO|nr:hypothetical protein KL946_003486 [Ogataea haglerorum]
MPPDHTLLLRFPGAENRENSVLRALPVTAVTFHLVSSSVWQLILSLTNMASACVLLDQHHVPRLLFKAEMHVVATLAEHALFSTVRRIFIFCKYSISASSQKAYIY